MTIPSGQNGISVLIAVLNGQASGNAGITTRPGGSMNWSKLTRPTPCGGERRHLRLAVG